MPEPLPPNPLQGDGAANYLEYRANAGADARFEQFMRETGGTKAAAKPGEAGSKPIAPGAGTAGATLDQQGTGSMAWRAAKDVGKGLLLEPMTNVKYGVAQGLKNTYDSADDFGKWADEKLGIDPEKEGLGSTGGMAAARKWVDETLGSVKAPESNTGKFMSGIYQFLTGMALTRRAMVGAGLPAQMEGAANYGYSALQGFVANTAAWDPHQTRLSNLIQDVPALRNPVTEFLAAKPDDTAAQGRLKNALEGLGLGVAADGLFKGIRLLRDIRNTQAAAPALAGEAAAPAAEAGVGEDAFRHLGDEKSAELVSDKPFTRPITTPAADVHPGVTPQEVVEAGEKMPEKPRVYINWARMDTPEEVQATMQQLADKFTGPTRVQGLEAVKLNAAQENAFDVLSARRKGAPLDAAQTTAVRQMWGEAGDKLAQMAQIAAFPESTPAEQFAFRKMAATFAMINEEVVGEEGFRRASARSLGAWRIPVGSNTDRLQDITARLADFGGGPENTRNMAQYVLERVSKDQPYELSRFANRSWSVRTRDGLIQAFTDGLLSAPKTQTKILSSNISTMLWAVQERKLAEAMGGGVAPGEAGVLYSAWLGSFRDGMAYLGKSIRTGTTGEGIGVPHEAYPSYLSSEALNLDSKSALGKTADFMAAAIGTGRRLVAAQHDMALTMSYQAEKHALSYRQAYNELQSGALQSKDFPARVVDLLQNTPDDIEAMAKESSLKRAFLNQPVPGMIGDVAQALLDARHKVPALRLIAPFVKIPANIFQYTFERTPLAPLMAEYRSKIAAGGAQKDLAQAQAAMGSMITMASADMVLSGQLKGGGSSVKGTEQAEEREGMTRDSIKVGNHWYNINAVHPIGKLMLMAADVAENLTSGDTEIRDPVQVAHVIGGAALAIGRTLMDNSYMQGFSELFATLHDANTKNLGNASAGLLSLAKAAVPNMSRTMAEAFDPYQREVYSMMDALISGIPGARQTLPVARDLWGNPKPAGYGGLARFVNPVTPSPETHTPIDDEIRRLNANIEMPPVTQPFGPKGNEGLVNMRNFPAEYSKMLELSGHELKEPFGGGSPKNLLDTLNDMVSGKGALSPAYNMAHEGQKAIMIRAMIDKYQQAARDELIRPGSPHYSPALAQEAHDQATARRSLRGFSVQ